jgi:hypothetical protein
MATAKKNTPPESAAAPEVWGYLPLPARMRTGAPGRGRGRGTGDSRTSAVEQLGTGNGVL